VSWIPPWAFAAFEIVQFIELDCSWEPTDPYAYCVPHAVVYNESIALGFIITPTEREDTYGWFYDDLKAMAQQDLPPKPILSDEGAAVTGFAGLKGLENFLCYFHLVHKWKPYRILMLMASRVLRIPDPKQFDSELVEIVIQLDLLIRKFKVPQKIVVGFAEFLGFTDFLGDRSKRVPFRHGLWLRAGCGMPTANAHQERFHGTVKKRTRARGQQTRARSQQSLTCNLNVIRDAIDEKSELFQQGSRAQLRRTVKSLTVRAARADDNRGCNEPKCLAYRDLMNHRFGLTKFPCKHQIHGRKVREVMAELTPDGPYPPPLNITPTVDTFRSDPVPPWPFAAHPRGTGQPSGFAFIPPIRQEALRTMSGDEFEFLVSVMRDAAVIKKARGDKAKVSLLLSIVKKWDEMQKEGLDPVHRRAAFWVDCMTQAEAKSI
jgi:hypothetical protein